MQASAALAAVTANASSVATADAIINTYIKTAPHASVAASQAEVGLVGTSPCPLHCVSDRFGQGSETTLCARSDITLRKISWPNSSGPYRSRTISSQSCLASMMTLSALVLAALPKVS